VSSPTPKLGWWTTQMTKTKIVRPVESSQLVKTYNRIFDPTSIPSTPFSGLQFPLSGLHPWIMQRFSDMDVSPGQELAISSKVNDDWIWGWISSGDQSAGTFSCLKDTHDGSMVLLYMVTWTPSIYPQCKHIYHTWILWDRENSNMWRWSGFCWAFWAVGPKYWDGPLSQSTSKMRVGVIFIPFIPNVVNPIVSLPFGDVFSFNHPFNSYPLMVMLRRDRFYH